MPTNQSLALSELAIEGLPVSVLDDPIAIKVTLLEVPRVSIVCSLENTLAVVFITGKVTFVLVS